MGPILLERATTPLVNKVSRKEKASRSSENAGTVAGSKKEKVDQNQKSQKKTGAQSKHPYPGKSSASKSSHCMGRTKPEITCINETETLQSLRKMGPKSLASPSTECNGERRVRLEPLCSSDDNKNHAGRRRGRHTLTLPLAPKPEALKAQAEMRVSDLEQVRLFEQKEEDTDSASDLSDSERLPVLPSPCTPPQLNLRAEVIDPIDLHPCFPGPWGQSCDSNYSYPDFLPPPFCTWSLRQLALFLNTEGRGAPRPKPVGNLEKYLERLLQLEWLQIQTIQAENSRPVGPGFTNRPRYNQNLTSHMAPGHLRNNTTLPFHLRSPKSLRHCQQTSPFAFMSSLGTPLPAHRSQSVCPSCHIHHPFCIGNCSSYTYHRHSRLSPVLERKVKLGVLPKRSSSESRVHTSKSQKPVSPLAGNNHLNHMQSAGNMRSPLQTPGHTSKPLGVPRNGCAVAARPKESVTMEGSAPCRSAREVNPVKRSGKVRPKAGVGDGDSKLGRVGTVSKGLPPTRLNGLIN
ncbi:uncharacterized protein fam217ba isoform X2 [Scleropages formosus]|uniref:uncharacterized protein fam217ba isoform X2 n=1 Tax=Scleropages formosus TaxID=113540 RepID=UPI000878F3FC|nr:protein FAM217B isoform X2 [Scleropages formosus]